MIASVEKYKKLFNEQPVAVGTWSGKGLCTTGHIHVQHTLPWLPFRCLCRANISKIEGVWH